MSSQSSKTALVTGGNKGIGFAICQGLLENGFEVFLAARDPEKGKAAINKLSAQSNSINFIELDVTSDRSIQNAVHQVSQTTDYLDVLVNNAGIYPDSRGSEVGVNILTVSRDLLIKTMNTNAFSPIGITQALLPLLEKAVQPKVINVSSGNGQLDGISANVPSYSLSKLALNGATILLADALKSRNIAVYAMCPGWVKTDMGGNSAPRTTQQGADTAIWLATEGTIQQSGKFFRNRSEQPY
jgi:NAD(P)-dependent dehydrogenase (short-subunit alcohol dehydrogenase family)